MTALLLAFLAGVLSILSPCVLPLLPIVLGAAASEHRYGPMALAGGLAFSFTVIGLFVATVGFSIGLDADFFRLFAAVLLVAIGGLMAFPALQAWVAAAAGPVSNWMEQRFGGVSSTGLTGQFSVGLLLGAVWSPCVGPTLGAASVLAARGQNLGQVSLTMVLFGLGAGLPLLLLGMISRQTMMRLRGRLLSAGSGLKSGLGVILILIGGMILTGWDKALETVLVQLSPDWLTRLTTQF